MGKERKSSWCQRGCRYDIMRHAEIAITWLQMGRKKSLMVPSYTFVQTINTKLTCPREPPSVLQNRTQRLPEKMCCNFILPQHTNKYKKNFYMFSRSYQIAPVKRIKLEVKIGHEIRFILNEYFWRITVISNLSSLRKYAFGKVRISWCVIT